MRPRKALKRLERATPGRRTGPNPKQPSLAAALLGLRVVELVAQGDTAAIDKPARVAEELLGENDPDIDDLVTFGFIEGLHNGASHSASGVGQRIHGELGPRSREAWESVRARLVATAEWMASTGQTVQPATNLDAIESEELRSLALVNYWRTPDDRLIGVADVADHETDAAERATRGFS